MPDHVPHGIRVYLPRGCRVGVQGVQKGDADLVFCEGIMRAMQSAVRALRCFGLISRPSGGLPNRFSPRYLPDFSNSRAISAIGRPVSIANCTASALN
jgi:hypothetical protein